MKSQNDPKHKAALEAYASAMQAARENRELMIDDQKFLAGDQWPDEVKAARKGRPIQTINRLPAFVDQIVGDARQNKPSIKVHPAEDGDEGVAEIYAGLIRNIEVESNADYAYDTAIEHSSSFGFGAWRITTDYCDAMTFDQDIKIERIVNPMSVLFGPAFQPDYSDAPYVFVVESITRDEYKRRWPKADMTTFDSGKSDPNWQNGEMVQVAEYWYKHYEPATLYLLQDGTTTTDAPPEKSMIVSSRPTEIVSIRMCVLSGAEILEEKTDYPGKYLPIIGAQGKEDMVDGKRILRGIVRFAKDPQRMYNYWRDLSLDTPIPTPDGWVTMRDIHKGSRVFNEKGEVVKVLGESPTYTDKRCYRVIFDDGSSIIASAEHTWTIERRGNRSYRGIDWQTVDVATEELVPGLDFIWATKPLSLPDVDLPIDPYVLGYWLGNGLSIGGMFYAHEKDMAEVSEHFCYDLSPVVSSGGRGVKRSAYGLVGDLRINGLLRNKHIPSQYLRASEQQRRALLQGMMDSDGTCHKTVKQCAFTTTTAAIAEGMMELIRSLGINPVLSVRQPYKMSKRGKEYACAESYTITFTAYADEQVFRLQRKAARLPERKHERRTKRHGISGVYLVPSVETKCIMVDTPSHLFLAGESMIPTHNTIDTEQKALAPRAPVLVTAEQIDGHEEHWKRALTGNLPFLTYNNEQGAPMPQRLNAGLPDNQAERAAMLAVDELKSTTGIFSASLGEQGNETSGRAILARQREGDTATYAYIDNLGRAIRHSARVIIDLIPHIYNTERVIQVMGVDGQKTLERINATMEDGSKVNDLTTGKYDLVVTVGPSYATKRIEALNNMVEIAKMNPAIMQVAGDLMVKAMDWEGAEEIADRLKLMLPPQILQAEQEGEGQQIPPELQAQIDQGMQLIEQQKAEIEKLQDELEDKDEDRRLRQYEIDVKAAIEAAKIAAANPDASTVAQQAAQILAQQWMEMAASAPDVTEEPEGMEMEREQPGMMPETEADMPMDMPEELPPELMPTELIEEVPNIPEITGDMPEEPMQ